MPKWPRTDDRSPHHAGRTLRQLITSVLGHTVAGTDAGGHIYILATHSGVTLGPLLGKLAAQEILDGEHAQELRDFRPARFAEATTFAPLAPARHGGEQ
jgi:hypothetical protein